MSDALKRLIKRKEIIESVVLGDVNHMDLLELEAMVLHHKQQIKDIAEHLLELRKWGSPMSEYICTCGIRVTPHKCFADNGF